MHWRRMGSVWDVVMGVPDVLSLIIIIIVILIIDGATYVTWVMHWYSNRMVVYAWSVW